MFKHAESFNQPLNNWNVSNVTNMNYMFEDATSFNQPLNKWNVSNVTDMWCMFWGAESFNQPLDNWNVSNVENMSLMFRDATSFNQPLNNWNVSNVIGSRDTHLIRLMVPRIRATFFRDARWLSTPVPRTLKLDTSSAQPTRPVFVRR